MERQFVRFTRLQRILHICMIVSFIDPGDDGLNLKFSYTKWAAVAFSSARWIRKRGQHSPQCRRRDVRSFHYPSGGPVPAEEKGARFLALADVWVRAAWSPTGRDLAELVGTLKWFVGLGKRPAYGRWTYWEKFDYFAVFWGIAVIGSTGLTLWFPVFFTRFIPGSFLNVATIIHSDEALLATGFIFTVHFFNTHLRPEKFPMDITVFTGRMPLEELKRDKPREYEALVASGKLEEYMEEAYPPIVTRTIRAFAWAALAVGFSIVLWIIYAVLFAYR